MKKYKVVAAWDTVVEAEDEDEAYEEAMKQLDNAIVEGLRQVGYEGVFDIEIKEIEGSENGDEEYYRD